jgi:hypothetical protein
VGTALFGKWSEVNDRKDCYANNEVNSLQQRIEAYRGFVVLTTNQKNASRSIECIKQHSTA